MTAFFRRLTWWLRRRRKEERMTGLPPYPDPDVLIVGAGPTGAVAAKRFLEAGMRVVVLEQGDWPDYSQARADHPDFELTMGRYWSGNPNRRQAPADYPIDDSGF